MSQMIATSEWAKRQQVSGVYHGQEFTGQITEDSHPTADYRNMVFCVALDAPVTVYGLERNQVEVWTNDKENALYKA
jgi:hypothetical protein